MTENLFAATLEQRLKEQQPLARRLRPETLEGIVGQEHLLADGAPLSSLIRADRLSSVILWGPPGTGKTTIAEVIARSTSKEFVSLSAVTATTSVVRSELDAAEKRLGEHGKETILFLDEVHRFNKAQQDTLLPATESGLIVLMGATTENPYFEVNPPLLSRSSLFRLRPLDDDALRTLLRRGLDALDATAEEDALEHLTERSAGDGRAALGALEVAAAVAQRRGTPPSVLLADAEAACDVSAVGYGRDAHYDTVSAFIKSIRGSDPDGGLYWLARMLASGEDARFVARRLVILASEDVGMADPQGLLIADAAARAVEFAGLPEAALNLAHAVIYLASAPKSNRVTTALGRARSDALRFGRSGEVPAALRDAHYSGAASIGHGEGYEYPHDDPRGWSPQPYRPEEVNSNVYYEPSPHGVEQEIYDRWRRDRGGEAQPGERGAAGVKPQTGIRKQPAAEEKAGGQQKPNAKVRPQK